jgi:hypothetical protein
MGLNLGFLISFKEFLLEQIPGLLQPREITSNKRLVRPL